MEMLNVYQLHAQVTDKSLALNTPAINVILVKEEESQMQIKENVSFHQRRLSVISHVFTSMTGILTLVSVAHKDI
jgi:predicted nucleotidyltransferase